MNLLRRNKADYVIELGEGEYLSDKFICLSGKNDKVIHISEKRLYIFKSYFQKK